MPVYHRTQRLQIYGEKPEVTQLFNDRYRIVVRCKAARDTEAWYNDNKSQIFADFGTLYNAQMSIDGIDSRTGEAYDNMVLVSNAVGYTQTGEYVVTFVYETLTATWTKEQEDTVSSTDNGLRIVERSEVATIAATAPYDEDDIGVSTITNGGKTLYLAGFQDETKAEADAQIGRVTTQWLEAGTLSETLDNVGAQKAKVIEAIGPDPATPTGYSLASKQESSFNGFQTNRFTFLKDNVELSRTNDYVGSQLAITREFFNPTSDPTESGYSLASKQQSDFEGIKTVKYVFLRDNILLSQSRDLAGSPLTVVQEWFNPDDRDEKLNYVLVKTEASNIDGIPTERYTFMRDCILRVDTSKVGGSQQVSVQAFDMTEAEVTAELAAVTASHELIDVQESDYEGRKTSTFVFEVNDFEVRSQTENGLQLLTRTELSITNFTDGDVGTDTYSGLYLAGEEIDNGNTIKKRVSQWAEAGVLSEGTKNISEGVREVTKVFLGVEGSVVGPIIRRTTSDIDGFKTISVTTLQDKNGNAINNGGSNLVSQHESLVTFTYPGVVSLTQTRLAAADYTSYDDMVAFDFFLTPPNQSEIEATTYVFFQNSSTIASSDYTYDGSDGFWNPESWASSYATGVDQNQNPFSVTNALRGYRAYEDVDVVLSPRYNSGVLVNGRPIFPRNVATIGINGGPSNPEGNKYVLSVAITPAYEDINGNVGYKKTIVVANIPTRTLTYRPQMSTLVDGQHPDALNTVVGSLKIGGFAEGVTSTTFRIPWNKAPEDDDVFNYNYVATVRGYNSSKTSDTILYRFVTDYDANTATVTVSNSMDFGSNNALFYFNFIRIDREGKAAGNGNGTNKIVLPEDTDLGSSLFDDVLNGQSITITSGAGAGQTRTITDFDGQTRTATVNSAWSPAIGPNSYFRIGPSDPTT